MCGTFQGDLGIRAEAVEQLIIYMYTGRVTISQQNVIDLIRAADLLELTSVKNETLKVIEEHISFDVNIFSYHILFHVTKQKFFTKIQIQIFM